MAPASARSAASRCAELGRAARRPRRRAAGSCRAPSGDDHDRLHVEAIARRGRRRRPSGSWQPPPSAATTARSASKHAAAAASLIGREHAARRPTSSSARLDRDDALARRRNAVVVRRVATEIRVLVAEPLQARRPRARGRRTRRRPASAGACRRCRESGGTARPGCRAAQLRAAAHAAGADRAAPSPSARPPLRAAPARRANPRAAGPRRRRGRRAASTDMSLALWTARSMAPREQRVLDLLDEQPLAARLPRAARPAADRRRS